MRQTTGVHDATYWEALVAAAATDTGLACADAERAISSQDPRGRLPEAESHLLYLLGAATGREDWFEQSPEVRRAYQRLGLDDEDSEFLDRCLDAVREHGAQARPDEWEVLRFHLTTAAQQAPGNWNMLFAPLVEGTVNHR